jgi:energy-converting hydrogenase Eha subunit E
MRTCFQILTLAAFLFQVVSAVMTVMLIKAITREKEELTGYKE